MTLSILQEQTGDIPNIDVSFIEKGEEPEVVDLLKTVFDHWPNHPINGSSLDYWRWKYYDSPIKLVNVTVAKSNGKIIGCNHGLYHKVKLFNKSLLSGIGADSAVHQDYRKIGVYRKCADLSKTRTDEYGLEFGFWVTSNPIFIDSATRKNRPLPPFELENMIWIKDIEEYLQKRDRKYRKLIQIAFNARKKIFQLIYNKNHSSDDYTVKDVSSFNEDASLFWDKLKNQYDLIIERVPEYLNHRYCDKRAGKYVVKAVYRGEEMLGYCVTLERPRDDIRELYLLDFLVLHEEPVAADILLKNMLAQFSCRVDSMKAWVVKNNYLYKVFRDNNFFQFKDKRFHLFFSARVENHVEWDRLKDSDPNRIHFALGDTDIM